MLFTYYGHACFSIETEGIHLLFDPFITPNPLAQSVAIDTIPADFIFISHAHEDHLADALWITTRTKALVIAPYELALWFQKQGVASVHPMNPGGSHSFPFGQIKLVNAIHSSSLPDGSYGGCPVGFLIKTSSGNFYYSGDTSLTFDMKLIPEWASLDFAVLCLGDTFTMGIHDAIIAADWVEAEQIVGVHYDTFPPIEIDHDAAIAAFAQAGKTLHLLPIGNSKEFINKR